VSTGGRGRVEIITPAPAQRTVARRAAEARATIPQLELAAEVHMERALELCTRESHSLRAVLVRACGLALREQPRANAAYRDGQFELYSRVNVALALPGQDGFSTATLFDADTKSLAELTETIADLRARARSLTQPERSGATFTLAHHEDDGVAWELPLVRGGQAAALAAGTVRETAVVRAGKAVPGHVMTIVLACDHRILYGEHAARLLSRVKELLEHGAV
jgi:pyruvate dehydrogenase E2 component (dihydrolipoamide acetyltransferase)